MCSLADSDSSCLASLARRNGKGCGGGDVYFRGVYFCGYGVSRNGDYFLDFDLGG